MSSSTNGGRGSLIPSPFEIAILLTIIVWLAASLATDASFSENLVYWGDGLWSLLKFMTQMCLILLGGHVVASSAPMGHFLRTIAKIPKKNEQVYLFAFCLSAFFCWLNWGLGLVASAFLCLELARTHLQIKFPFLVAVSYMGFLFWHGGLSGSIPLTLNTPGSFSEPWVGKTLGLEQTIFSSFNIGLILSLLFTLSLWIYFLSIKSQEVAHQFKIPLREKPMAEPTKNFFSQILYFALIIFFASYLVTQFIHGSLSFGLNQINMILIFLGLLLHKNLSSYQNAITLGCKNLSPLLIQYPLYAGIMGIMVRSGLAGELSQIFVSVSSPKTYSALMFLSAGVVNFFVPSGGGQWAVQAPIVIEGAKQLGVPIWKAALAVAWGDAWTNLVQPFWALPLLSIAGVEIQAILKPCVQALMISGIICCGFFLFF